MVKIFCYSGRVATSSLTIHSSTSNKSYPTMEITTSYHAPTQTLTVTDATVYEPGELALQERVLLVDGSKVATFEPEATELFYTFPADGLYEVTVQPYLLPEETGEEPTALTPSETLTQLVVDYAYQKAKDSLLNMLIADACGFSAILCRFAEIRSIRFYFAALNYIEVKKRLKNL